MEHSEENSHLTLWQFLYTHYVDVDGTANKNDNQLPFKTHDNCVTSIINVFLPSQKFVIIQPVQFIENQHFKTQEQFLN